MAVTTHWRDHIEAWQGSGLKPADYCREYHINYKTFMARLSDHRRETADKPPALIPITVTKEPDESITSAQTLVLILKQGHRLELPETVSVQWLSALLRGLG